MNKSAKSAAWLLDHQMNIHSQSGEDGIIRKILDALPFADKWCVEFGALDGVSLSNTRNLIDSHGYSAVLIEGGSSRFKQLRSNYLNNSRVTTINRLVGFSKSDNLDSILDGIPIPPDFDFLSIDIDGNDYHVWDAMSRLSPKVVCIEFNHTIPNEVDFVQEADPRINQGSSLSALVRLGKTKGYELVSVLGVNAFFVKSEYFDFLEIADNGIESLWVDRSGITHIFVGYDGTIFLRGNARIPWHCRIPMRTSKLQILPKWLRKFPENYGKARLVGFGFFLLFLFPVIFWKEVGERCRRFRRS